MNELIEEMWVKFSYDTDISLYSEIPESIEELMDYHDFKQAIQTACKAQRNACVRRFQEELTKRIHGANSLETIQHAEITEEDYE